MSNGQLIQTIGILAAIASTASFAPQAWKIISTRDVEGLSAKMYALTVVAFLLWLSYGVGKGDWTLIGPNAICLVLSLFILAMIMMPQKKRDAVANVIQPDPAQTTEPSA